MPSIRPLFLALLLASTACGTGRAGSPTLPGQQLAVTHSNHGNGNGHGHGHGDGDGDDGDDDDDPTPTPTLTPTATPTPAPAGIPTPILEYHFDAGVGLSAQNTGSFANADGVLRDANTVAAGPEWSSDTPPTGGTFSLSFDGINDWVRVPDSFNYTVDGSMWGTRLQTLTIEAWVKPNELANQRVLWDDYGNPGVLLALWDGRIEWGISTDTNPGLGVAVYSNAYLPSGTWTHIAGTYDGQTLRVFVDGCPDAAEVKTSGAIINDTHWPIGIGADGETIPGLNWSGNIDELRLFSVALDRSQLAGGYFAGQHCAGDAD